LGADYFGAGLKHCHSSHPEIPLFRVDLTDAGFPDNLFDGVACLNVLEHIENDTLALRSISRILKPGGITVITVPAAPHLFDLYDEVHFHHRRYTLEELSRKTRDANLTVVKANYFGSFLYPAFYFVKRRNQRRYADLSPAEKRKIVLGQVEATSQSHLMNAVCQIEQKIGNLMRFPFGIRAFVVARKENSR